MYNKIRKNRKAESMLVDFWAILVFAIICVLLFIVIMLSRSDNTQTIQEEFANKDVNLILNSFLRAPYSTWGGQSIAEIIAEDKIKGDYTRTKQKFLDFFPGAEYYSGGANLEENGFIYRFELCVNGDSIEYLELKNAKLSGCRDSSASEWAIASTIIPSDSGDITVTLVLYHGVVDFGNAKNSRTGTGISNTPNNIIVRTP
jgi:hypothetical protein